MEHNIDVMEGTRFPLCVTLQDGEGNALAGDGFRVYGGACCPGMGSVVFPVSRSGGDFVVMVPGLAVGRIPWRYQVFVVEQSTGVEWLLVSGEVRPEARCADASGGVSAGSLTVTGVLDRNTLSLGVQLGESTEVVRSLVVRAEEAVRKAEAAAKAAAEAAEKNEQVAFTLTAAEVQKVVPLRWDTSSGKPTAYGNGLVVFGGGAKASTQDVVMGDKATGSGQSVVLGYGAFSQYCNNVIVGYGAAAIAYAEGAVAVGFEARASDGAVAIGYGAEARTSDSIAVGEGAIAQNAGSIVLGLRARDSFAGAVALSGCAEFIGSRVTMELIPGIPTGGTGHLFSSDPFMTGAALKLTVRDELSGREHSVSVDLARLMSHIVNDLGGSNRYTAFDGDDGSGEASGYGYGYGYEYGYGYGY